MPNNSLAVQDRLSTICERLAEGQSLRAICRNMDLPEASVRRWISQSDDAMAQSTHARELGCDSLADECVDISNDLDLDPAHKRIMIDTRIRLIGKWHQARYGDKSDLNVKLDVDGELLGWLNQRS